MIETNSIGKHLPSQQGWTYDEDQANITPSHSSEEGVSRMIRVAVYARVSTKRDGQKHSIDNQIAIANDLIARNGWVLAGYYVDDGISGKSLSKREQMQSLLQDARKKKFDAVIGKSVSRLGRNSVENMQTARDIENLGIRLILPEDSYDTTTKTSRLNFDLRAILAEEESARYALRIRWGRQGSARLGKYQASLPALGYKRDGKGKLVLDEEYAPIARKIFDLYLYEGWGMYKISNYLTREKVPTPRTISGGSNAGELWHQSTIKLILKNIMYTGTLVQHREEVIDFITQKRRIVPVNEQIIIENAHPAIISEREFNSVQELMKKKGKNKSNGKESLFAHIAVCADCGKGMVYRKDRGKSRNGAYVCCGYVKHSKSYCTSHLIESDYLLDTVKMDIKELVTNNVKLDKIYNALKGKAISKLSTQQKDLQKVNKSLGQLASKFHDLFELYNQKIISMEQFSVQNQHLQEDQSGLSKKKAELESLLDAKKDMDVQIHAFQKQIAKFAHLDIDDETILKQMLQKVIHKIVVHEGGLIKIHYNIACPHITGDLEEGA